MFEFGITIQKLVLPVLDLFKADGFAPLLAFLMAVVAVALVAGIYLIRILPGKRDLRIVANEIRKIASHAKPQEEFTNEFNVINEKFGKVKILSHSWSEFCETLISPGSDDKITIYRNTVRPAIFINIPEIESSLCLKLLHSLSNYLIGIGLLLTFIGLVAALTEAGKSIQEAGNGDFQEPIRNLLGVAAFKFWTSVSGLGCSIAVKLFYESQQNEIKRLLHEINSGIERGLQFVTPESLANDLLGEAKEQTAAMKGFSTDVAHALKEEFQPVNTSLLDIGNRITGGMGDAIKDAAGSEMRALANNLIDVAGSLEKYRNEMDSTVNTIRTTVTEAAETLCSSSGAASSEMAQQMRDVITTMAAESRKQTEKFDESMGKLSSLIDQTGEAASRKISKAANDLAFGMNGVSENVQDAANTMAERMQNLATVMQSIEERMNAHIQAMDALTGMAQNTEKAMGVTSRILSDATVPVTRATDKMAITAENLNQSISGIKQIIQESHEALINLTRKMEETQQTLQQAWKSYEQRFGVVDENLDRALHGIVENVKNNIQNMRNFVVEMDKNLGQAVSTFGQSVSELNETAESIEKATSNIASKLRE